jgi:hypothetical protein
MLRHLLPVPVLLSVLSIGIAHAQTDLQGVWRNRWVVHLERPESTPSVVMAEPEALAYANTYASRPGRSIEAPFFGPEKVEPLRVRGEYRSSVVVDPPDGRIPYTPEGLRRLRTARPAGADGPEARSPNERCMGGWGRPPILTHAVGNLRQIVQAPESVVIWSDITDEVRIIPLDGRRMISGSFQGVSEGRWEEQTLVVETTAFRAEEPLRRSPWHSLMLTPDSRVTERFTRVSENEIAYLFTVEDATLYQRPWTGESVFLRSNERMLEYACHEGNYAMTNILQGARMEDLRNRARK